MDREKVIKGLEFTKAMITFNPSTGEDIEPENLNEADKTTYDACVGAISLLKEQEAVEPIPPTDESDLWKCGNCNHQLFRCTHQRYCEMCGRPVKWE